MGTALRRDVLLAAAMLVGCGDDGSAADDTSGSSSSGPMASSPGDSSGPAPTECEPGQSRACYEGPLGTADVGRCRSGAQTCVADGSGWSACEGEIWPEPAEDCRTPEDDDCSGASTCAAALEWSYSFPGFIYDLQATSDGHVIMTGYGNGFIGELELFGLFVLRLDPAGTVDWAHVMQAADIQVAGLAVGPDDSVTAAGYYIGSGSVGGEPLPPSAGLDAFAVRYAADGTVQWQQTAPTQGYHGVSVGADGTTYLTGGDIGLEVDGEFQEGRFFVRALDPSGAVRWTTLGQGAYLLRSQSSIGFTADGGLVVAMAMAKLADVTPDLGGMPVVFDLPGPVALWMDTDGNGTGSATFTDEPLTSTGRVWISGRPEGAVAVADVTQSIDGDFSNTLLLTAFDPAGRRRSTSFIGSTVELGRVDAHPWGGILLGVQFIDSLELGPIGVAHNGYEDGYAVTVVDDLGRGQWVEVLHGEGEPMITATAAAPDGGVFVAGSMPGVGALAGETVSGLFIAKLSL